MPESVPASNAVNPDYMHPRPVPRRFFIAHFKRQVIPIEPIGNLEIPNKGGEKEDGRTKENQGV
jgi:hypothetical protein